MKSMNVITHIFSVILIRIVRIPLAPCHRMDIFGAKETQVLGGEPPRSKRLSRIQRLLSHKHVKGVVRVYVGIMDGLPNINEEDLDLLGRPS